MALQDQIKAAQAEGYSSQEIVQYLSASNPQVQEAVKEGYQPDEIISFLNQTPAPSQGVLGAVSEALKTVRPLGPTTSDIANIKDISGQLGKDVKAGGAGISDIVAGNGLPQAAQDVNAVQTDQSPTSTSGKVGSTVGSFFTPNQIVATATGGAVAEPIANAVGNTAGSTIEGLTKWFPKAASWTGLAPKAVGALATNPEAVAGAQELPEVAQNVASTVQGLRQSGMDVAAAGREALSDETPVVGLRDKLMNYAANLQKGPASDEADKAAADYVSNFAKNIELNPSESDIGDMIKDLDSKINTKYNQMNPNSLTEAKIGIRRTLDQALQGQNPQYAKAMAQASGTFEPASTLETSFGVNNGNTADRTLQALKNKAYLTTGETPRALASTPGLSDAIRNAVAKNSLQQGLLGRLGLFLAPKVNPAVQGAVTAVPSVGNAAAQTFSGLTQ